jgi:hypothetical protein
LPKRAKRSPVPSRTADTESDGGFKLSELDERIKELNNQGLSQQQISNALKAAGMGLSKSSVYEHLKEIRLLQGHKILANFKRVGGIPMEEQRWYKIILWLREEVNTYQSRHGFKPSIRTMFYQAVDEKRVRADEYNSFNSAATDARMGYVDQDGKLLLPRLPIDCFVDDSRKVIENYDDSEPTEVEEPGEIPDSDEHIDYAIERLMNAPANYDGVGDEGTDGEQGGYWYNQPKYVEAWVEKNDLVKGTEKILEDVHVNIRGNKGYSSLAFLHQCTQELKELIEEKGLDKNNIYILWNGDWDPSGENIDYYIKRRLAQLGLSEIHFIRVAVTPEQIDKYHLPLLPVEKGEDKKAPNPNMKEFIRRYGYKATHLNAFFTETHLPTYKKILIDAVNEHWDENIYNAMVDEYEVAPNDPPALSREEIREKRIEMYRKITEIFSNPSWYRGLLDAPADGDGDTSP